MMKPSFPAMLAAAIALTTPHSFSRHLEISAGGIARDHSIVTFDRPPDMPGVKSLRTDDGRLLNVFKTPGDKLAFISPPLEAGAKLLLTPVETPGKPDELVELEDTENRMDFKFGGRTIAGYQSTPRKDPRPGLDPRFLRGGYLHPLFTPSGKIVSDDYALNHLHHHGIWMAWTKAGVDGRETDFWNMGQGKGRADFKAYDRTWQMPGNAGLIARHKYTDLTGGSPVDVLEEKWTVSVPRPAAGYNIIDLEAEQTTLDGRTLELPAYHYGGLGIRGREEWNGADSATFITSGSASDRNAANGQPARWIRITGKVEGGGLAGIAILSHPDNFRSPQPVRIHPKEPFISFAPQIGGSMSIKPGETYKARYRFIISDGGADPTLLERLWQDYANPVTAKWVE